MIDGVSKKSDIIKSYINQRQVQLVDQDIDVDYLEKQLIICSPHQWKDLNQQLTVAKTKVTELKRILKVMEEKHDEYLKEEVEEAKPGIAAPTKKADK